LDFWMVVKMVYLMAVKMVLKRVVQKVALLVEE